MCLFKQFNTRQHSSTPQFGCKKTLPSSAKKKELRTSPWHVLFLLFPPVPRFLGCGGGQGIHPALHGEITARRENLLKVWSDVKWCFSDVLLGWWFSDDVKNHERTLGEMKSWLQGLGASLCFIWVFWWRLEISAEIKRPKRGKKDKSLPLRMTEPWYWLVAKHGTKQKKNSMRIILSRM